MAVIFQTIFDEGDWSAWDGHSSSRTAPFPGGYGLAGGPSNTCNHGPGVELGANFKYATTPVSPPAPWGLTDLAIRMQYAIVANKNFDSGFTQILSVGDAVIGISIASPFQAIVAVKSDGSLTLRIINADGATYATYTSSAGVFTLDGTIHGVQLVLSNLTPTSVDYELVVNNVSILSGTHVPSGSPCTGWGYYSGGFTCGNWHPQAGMVEVTVWHYRDPLTGPVDVMSNCAEVIFDDAASVVDYPASSAPAIGEFTCYQVAAPTALSVNCVDGQIIIDGTDFSPSASIELQGPEAVVHSFNVVNISPTQIVLDTLDPPFVDGGRYCVTVTNPLT